MEDGEGGRPTDREIIAVRLPGPRKSLSLLIKYIQGSANCLSKNFLEEFADTVLPNSANNHHHSNIRSYWACDE